MRKNNWKGILGMILALALLFAGAIGDGAVSQAAAAQRINLTNLTMAVGQTRQLKISGSGSSTWRSSDKSVVAVSKKGRIRAKKAGSAVITGTKNGQSLRCRITVNDPSKSDQNILVVYFSKTGTTQDVAEKIQKLTGGDLLRIQEKEAYPDSYNETVDRARKELDEESFPAITSAASNMKDYDVVYVGFPIWWHSTPRVINTFLQKYKLQGKTVIPFCTSGGSDIEEAMPVIEELCSGSTILEGYTAGSGSESEIRTWLRKIGQI